MRNWLLSLFVVLTLTAIPSAPSQTSERTLKKIAEFDLPRAAWQAVRFSDDRHGRRVFALDAFGGGADVRD
jgi:hypothetical protein